MESWDRVEVLAGLGISIICNLDQVRLPNDRAILINDLEGSIQRCIHHRVISVNPCTRLVSFRNRTGSVLRFWGSGSKDRFS